MLISGKVNNYLNKIQFVLGSNKEVINLRESVIFLYAISTFLALNPYFIWPTYSEWGTVIFQVLLCTNLLVVFIYLLNKKLEYNKILLAILYTVFFLFTFFYTYNGKINYGFGSIILTVLVVLFFQLDDLDQKKVFKIFSIIFAITVIPGIIYWIGEQFNIVFDYKILFPIGNKTNSGFVYKNYFGAVTMINRGWVTETPRMCGIYDEPGVVGTVAALLLAGDRFELKKNPKNIIILISGILSFSLAFYMMMILYFLMKNITIKPKKILIFVCVLFACVFFVVNYGAKNDIFNRYVLSRFEVQDGKMVGNNRTSSNFDYVYNNHLKNATVKELFIGKGSDAANSNVWMGSSSTYKKLIYDYGLIGILYILFFILEVTLIKHKKTSKDMIIFMLIFIISVYQRPYIMNLQYMVILITGLSNLFYKNNTEENSEILL